MPCRPSAPAGRPANWERSRHSLPRGHQALTARMTAEGPDDRRAEAQLVEKHSLSRHEQNSEVAPHCKRERRGQRSVTVGTVYSEDAGVAGSSISGTADRLLRRRAALRDRHSRRDSEDGRLDSPRQPTRR